MSAIEATCGDWLSGYHIYSLMAFWCLIAAESRVRSHYCFVISSPDSGGGFKVCVCALAMVNLIQSQGMEYHGLLWKEERARLCQSGLLGRPSNKNDAQFVRTVFMGVFKVCNTKGTLQALHCLHGVYIYIVCVAELCVVY